MITWRCTLCGQCCKSYVPLILDVDVKLIQHSGRALSSFITFYQPSDFNGPVDESYESQFFQTKHGKLAIGLSRIDLPDGQVGCVFLKDNLCTIHPIRPHVCRMYPFRPEDENVPDGAFKLMDDPCFGNHAEDQVVDEAPLRQDYAMFLETQEAYLAKVKAWNDNPESATREIEDFLTYIGLQWT